MTAITADAGHISAWLRERRRANRPPLRTGDVLYRLYLMVFFGVPVVWYINRAIALDALLLPPGAQAAVRDLTSAILPALLLIGLVAGLRFGAWQGPVVLSHPDTRWVLTAPVARRALLFGPLSRGLAVAGGIGAVLGLLVAAVGAVLLGAGFLTLLGLSVLGFAAYGALIGALAWFVECSPQVARAVLRWTPAVVVAAILIAAIGVVAHPWPGIWGPPGWVAAMVLAGLGAPPALWPVALVLLVACVAAAVVGALRRAGDAPYEQLKLRSTFGAGFRASIYFLDLRAAGLARRAASRAVTGRTARRLRPPRTPFLLPAWVHLLQIVRARRIGRFVIGCVLAVIAMGVTRGNGLVVYLEAAGVVLAGYVAASAVIEPVWAEREQRFGQHHLRGGFWTVVVAHTIVAAVFLAVALSAGMAVLVLVVPRVDPIVILLGLVLGPLLALAAAVPPTGPPPDASLLLFGDNGIAMVAGALLRGPLMALLLAVQPTATVLRASAPADLAPALVWGGITSGLTLVWLQYRVGELA